MASYNSEVDVVDSVKFSTLRYSAATFIRMFADWRDGLKPVNRRILYTLHEHNVYSLTKVANLCGNVLKYHPHGDSSVYGALVRMAQPWVMNHPYIIGSGNFGTQAGDPSAAGRYIEAMLSPFSRKVVLEELDNVTVNFIDNYDNKSMVPEYLPAKIPLVLVNGSSGIGVAFKSDIPPHNLIDICDRCISYIKNKNITNSELCEGLYPDFPTGGEIVNGAELQKFYKNGEPCVIQIRGKANFVPEKNMIVMTEFPYGINIDDISEAVQTEIKNGNMVLSGIETILDNNNNDDSETKIKANKKGTTYEYTCKKDANVVEILNEICKKTQFQTSIPLSFMICKHGYPKTVTVKDIITDWYAMRRDCKRRRHQNNIAKAQDKKHLYEGLLVVFDRLNEVLSDIQKNTEDQNTFIEKVLKPKYGLTMSQGKAICESRLMRISRFGQADLKKNLDDLMNLIRQDEWVLSHIDEVIIKELEEIKQEFGRPRRTVVHQSIALKARETPVISKGSFVYSHCEIGLYDVNGSRDSRGIMTGLRAFKINGKGVREIIGGCSLKTSPKGFVVCYSDGTMHAIDASVFKILNVWYDTKCDEKDATRYISAACPYYSDEDEVICLSKDFKVKRVDVSQLNKRVVASGDVITNIVSHNKNDEDVLDYLIVSNKGKKGATYSMSPIEDTPSLGRSAAGVKSAFDSNETEKVFMCEIDSGDSSDDNRIMVSTIDNSGQSYIHTIPVNALKISQRTNKPKLLALPPEQEVTSISQVRIENNQEVLCMIGKNGCTTLNLRSNFKKPFSFKRLFLQVVAALKL